MADMIKSQTVTATTPNTEYAVSPKTKAVLLKQTSVLAGTSGLPELHLWFLDFVFLLWLLDDSHVEPHLPNSQWVSALIKQSTETELPEAAAFRSTNPFSSYFWHRWQQAGEYVEHLTIKDTDFFFYQRMVEIKMTLKALNNPQTLLCWTSDLLPSSKLHTLCK